MQAPTSATVAQNSSSSSTVRRPGRASSLSSVPPVWPRPRPEIIGTATPHAAAAGASGSEALSPTPPVECLSAVGRSRCSKEIVSPECSMAWVQSRSSAGSMPRR